MHLVQVYVPRRELRSSNDNSKLLKPVMNYKSYGEKSFSFYGPTVWNNLPFNLRNIDNLNTFKTHLKTYSFKQAYNLQYSVKWSNFAFISTLSQNCYVMLYTSTFLCFPTSECGMGASNYALLLKNTIICFVKLTFFTNVSGR